MKPNLHLKNISNVTNGDYASDNKFLLSLVSMRNLAIQSRRKIFQSAHLLVYTLAPLLLLFLLLLTPFMVSHELYDGINSAKDFWFFSVVAAILLYVCYSIYTRMEPLQIKLNVLDILLLIFYLWCFIRASFTPYTPVWQNQKLQILTGMVVVYFFTKSFIGNKIWTAEIKNKKAGILGFIKSQIGKKSFGLYYVSFLMILTALIQAVYGLLQLYGFYPSHHGLFKITGSFFNPAPYALYLASIFPLALMHALSKRPVQIKLTTDSSPILNIKNIFKFMQSFLIQIPANLSQIFHYLLYYISWATVIAVILVLPATMNRASWLGAIAGTAIVLEIKYKLRKKLLGWLNTTGKRLMAILIMVLFLFSSGLGLFYLKSGSSNGRLFIWEVTFGKIVEKPLAGYGLGRFKAEYNNWQAAYFMAHPEEIDGIKGYVAGNTKYAFNEFLEMASEIGIVGIIIFLTFIMSGIAIGLKHKSCFIPSIIALIICALISFPFYSLPTFIILFVIMGSVSTLCDQKIINISNTPPLFKPVLFFFFLLVSAVISLSFVKKPYYKTWQQASYQYSFGNYDTANKLYESCLPALTNEGIFMQMYGKNLQMSGNDLAAVKIFELAKQLTSDQVLFTSLGDSYKNLGIYDEAELSYHLAGSMQPNTLYPHYLLAKLHAETGQSKKALEKAQEVIDKEVKVMSTAIDEIKFEMQELIKASKF